MELFCYGRFTVEQIVHRKYSYSNQCGVINNSIQVKSEGCLDRIVHSTQVNNLACAVSLRNYPFPLISFEISKRFNNVIRDLGGGFYDLLIDFYNCFTNIVNNIGGNKCILLKLVLHSRGKIAANIYIQSFCHR